MSLHRLLILPALLVGAEAHALCSQADLEERVGCLADALQTAQTQIESLESKLSNTMEAVDALEYDSVPGLADYLSVDATADSVIFSGANVYIQDGSGDTSGAVNGLGNLIIGYAEAVYAGIERSGSHNLAVGMHQSWSSYGGIVAGYIGSIEAPFAAVLGGSSNTASGTGATVCGGSQNVASASYASVSGGSENLASGLFASVSGGSDNVASGDYAAVSGGGFNLSYNDYSATLGGFANRADADYAAVVGGRHNVADASYSTVAGGGFNNATGEASAVSGGRGNDAMHDYATVTGGYYIDTSESYDVIP